MTAYGAFEGGIGASAKEVLVTPMLGQTFLKVGEQELG